MNSVLKRMDQSHILMYPLCNNNFNIFLPSMSRSPKWPFLEIHFYKIQNQHLSYTAQIQSGLYLMECLNNNSVTNNPQTSIRRTLHSIGENKGNDS